MAAKDFIDEAITKRQIVALVSLDVKGAFDAAWCPSVIKALKDFYCPRNLYNLTKNNFTDRSAFITTNNIRRLPSRVLQRTRILEHPIQFTIKLELRKMDESNSVC